jgi:uncharacterized hydantoinase/oxoprolinase family protein
MKIGDMRAEDIKRVNELAEKIFNDKMAENMEEAVEKAKKIILNEEIRQGFAEEEAKKAIEDIEMIDEKLRRSLKDDEEL